jgi:hypothetical protein
MQCAVEQDQPLKKTISIIRSIIRENGFFLLSLGQTAMLALFALLLLQAVAYGYFAATIPLHYDEWNSWRFFSGDSFRSVLTYYPAPNNHVFYNLVARCFVVMKIDSETAIRLPSVVASVLTSYYFFKLCRNAFGTLLSLGLLAILIVFYNYIFYSVEARGYSFVNLFCVLLMYASGKLSEGYSRTKYRFLFIVSQFLGVFTVPSFLYVMFPAGVLLFVYLLKERSLKKLILFAGDYCIVAILIFAGYSGILFIGDPQQLLHPETWTDKFSFGDSAWSQHLSLYLGMRFYELFGYYQVHLAGVLIILSVIYHISRFGVRHSFLCLLCAFMFFSPAIIVILHGVFPFGRTFYYLLFPSLIALGFITVASTAFLKNGRLHGFLRRYNPLFYTALILAVTIKVSSFGVTHHMAALWDYKLSWLRESKLLPAMHGIREISRTTTGNEFYPAEVISHMCAKNYPDNNVRITVLDSIRDQDLLVINESELSAFWKRLQGYECMMGYADTWIFMSKDLAKDVKLRQVASGAN